MKARYRRWRALELFIAAAIRCYTTTTGHVMGGSFAYSKSGTGTIGVFVFRAFFDLHRASGRASAHTRTILSAKAYSKHWLTE